MWAFGCGVVASGVAAEGRWPIIVVGLVLAGPMVCASSQAVNDWFDRHVDAINEPNRPIPSGRMPGRWGLAIAILWTGLSLLVAAFLGPWGFGAAVIGLLLAWAYSAPPLRLKLNGWWGNAACGLCYEGLAWTTGAAVMAGGAMPPARSLALAALYSAGAHGIMTLNDFKSVEGDRQMGVGSLPVRLGVPGARAGHRRLAGAASGVDGPLPGRPAQARDPVQRLRGAAVRGRHDGQRLRAAQRGRGRMKPPAFGVPSQVGMQAR